MRGFARRQSVERAIAWLDAQLQPLDPEPVPLRMAARRVLAESIVSNVDVPGFDRATMDGYALAAESTEGATSYNRLPLTVIGDSLPGRPFPHHVGAGQAVRIMTGAPMPQGCDAVLPAEWVDSTEMTFTDERSECKPDRAQPSTNERSECKPDAERKRDSAQPQGRAQPSRIVAVAAVSPGKHVGRRGEDVTQGTALLPHGRLLRPQDLGVLSSVGVEQVHVYRRPRVRLVVTGNELLPAGSRPHGHCIADANGPMLAALVERDGGLVDFPSLVPDEHDAILDSLYTEADVVIVSGGSSVGLEDLAPTLLASHGELAVHGIAMRPSSPTGFGRLEHRLVFLLPGNPVSCLCAYDFFAGRAIRALGGLSKTWPYHSILAKLARKISSPIGRLDYARVRLVDGDVEPIAVSGASILSSTTRADGFVIVPADSEGFAPGSEVEVWLYA
jgi:molybdopterin molybdotransferase